MLVLNWISHKYDFAVRIFQAYTQYAPPPNPPIDTTQGWKETHLTIHYLHNLLRFNARFTQINVAPRNTLRLQFLTPASLLI